MATLPKEAFKQPRDRSFYGTLLKLEDKFTRKLVTLDEVGLMADMYGQIVSYYDTQGDPIKYYFLEKIQVTVAECAVIALKEKDKEQRRGSIQAKQIPAIGTKTQPALITSKPPRSLSGSSHSSGETHQSEMKDQVCQLPEDVRSGLQQNLLQVPEQPEERNRTTSITTQRKTRQKKMSLLIELNKAQEQEPEQYNKLLGSYEQDVSKNDQNIKKQLREQSDTLQQRIEERKKNRTNRKANARTNRDTQSLGEPPEGIQEFKQEPGEDLGEDP